MKNQKKKLLFWILGVCSTLIFIAVLYVWKEIRFIHKIELRAKEIQKDAVLQKELLAKLSKNPDDHTYEEIDHRSFIGILRRGVIRMNSGDMVFVVFLDHHSNIGEVNKMVYWGKDNVLRTSQYHVCGWLSKCEISTIEDLARN